MLREHGKTYSRQSGDLVTGILKRGRKLVQTQAVVLVLVVEFEQFFDLWTPSWRLVPRRFHVLRILGQGATRTLVSSS